MKQSRRYALKTFSTTLATLAVCGRPGALLAGPRTWIRDSAAFLAAVRAGQIDRVERMLAADPTLAASVDERGRSAYLLARLAGAEDVAARLLAEDLELDIVEAVLAQDWRRVEALAIASSAA